MEVFNRKDAKTPRFVLELLGKAEALSGGSVLRGVVILPQTKARRFTKKQHLHKDRRVRTL